LSCGAFDVKDSTCTPLAIQKLIARGLLISLLYYAMLACVKNYRVHRHLAVLNEHRRNALKTFGRFIAAVGADDETRGAVLLATTQAIFAPAPSGYLGTDEPDPTPMRVAEMIKSLK